MSCGNVESLDECIHRGFPIAIDFDFNSHRAIPVTKIPLLPLVDHLSKITVKRRSFRIKINEDKLVPRLNLNLRELEIIAINLRKIPSRWNPSAIAIKRPSETVVRTTDLTLSRVLTAKFTAAV